uniref:Carrier domain-containing protein n=1 Tax=Trichobilharzia regenti TaxID=157069 RepID=A0AA85JQ17_TRIRE|nr:unnamed protein product [Trichobilharzia regenti]
MPHSLVQLKSPLLHTLLENLTQSSVCDSTAIWHVPNPINFTYKSTESQLTRINDVHDTSTNFTDDISNNNNNINGKMNENQYKNTGNEVNLNDCQRQIQKWVNDENNNSRSTHQEANEIYSTTFSQLNNSANRMAMNLANYLEPKWSSITNKINRTQLNDVSCPSTDQSMEHKSQSDTIVALFMPPGIDRIVAQIACMKLHLAYMPFDRNVPAGRISQFLSKIKPILILIAKDYYDYIYDKKDSKDQHYNCSTVTEDGRLLCDSGRKFTSNDFMAGSLDDLRNTFQLFDLKVYEYIKSIKLSKYHSRSDIYTASIPTRSCLFPFESDPVVLVLFTSGSVNSDPKPVKLRTKQLLRRLEWQWNPVSDMDLPNLQDTIMNPTGSVKRIGLAKTAWSFVDGFTELFSCLLAGVPVVVPGGSNCPSEKSVTDVQQLMNLTKYFHISHITTVPAQLDLWLKQLHLKPKQKVISNFSSLRTVVVSGDIIHPKVAREFFQLFSSSKVRLINLYGTTEVAGDVTGLVFHNEEDVVKNTKIVPYGVERENKESGRAVLSVGTLMQGTAILIVQEDDSDENILKSEENNTNLDKWSTSSLSFIGSVKQSINLEQLPFKLLPKGHVGQVCIIGQQLSENVGNYHIVHASLDNPKCCNQERIFIPTEGVSRTSCNLKEVQVFMPGDLGFIDPHTDHLFIYGRTNELVKVNGIRFHARDVDNLFLELKKKWESKGLINCSKEEQLVNKVSETVTLTIQTVHGRDLKLACFYVVKMDDNRNITNHSTVNIEPIESREKLELPREDDFAAIFCNYIPSCLLPTFINVDHIPLMRTNGKVDKEYLRQYYYSKYYCDIPEISKPIQPTWRSETIRKIIDNNIIPCSITKRADQANHQNTVDFQVMKSRERARKVLAEVLGIYSSNGDVIPGRPKDDEDFYLLGGDSLLSVLATEQLRQLGFNADLDIFTRTGKIGSILSYLEKSEPDYEKKKEEALVVNSWRKDIPWHKIFKRSQTCNAIYRIHLVEDDWGDSPKIYPLGNYEIFIEEWNNEKGCGTKRQEIVDTLVNAFIEKDRLSHALKLDRGDLQEAVEAFLGNHKPNLGIVLTARYYCQNSCEQVLEQDKLVGALISLPVSHVPSLNRTPKLEILQHYFDVCTKQEAFPNISPDNLLSTLMVGIMSQSPYSNSNIYRVIYQTGRKYL